ncbi:hypothetical protein Acsp03_46500 [Actinomadura sp. NBRC 104412]|uniref:hypothetical protein n=1 Tax=Actinomadura sp. NBRC 104412 TaxID=3032203 RepID=UPI0024A364AB|nr:hypothetical protein [Actinomadura sp. NBRC 104412]GLZ07184.1 hypothetical protein Acsp03_46500 [Actinomadura sp. NBRC 104412]
MMKRLAASAIVTTALGGALMTATPALANDDDNTVNQEKVAELNVLCNVAVLAVQKDANCGGTKSVLSDRDQANEVKIRH